jgi:hypothetical protein
MSDDHVTPTEATDEALRALSLMRPQIQAGSFVYCYEARPSKGAECWAWLSGLIDLTYKLIKKGGVRRLHILVTYDDVPSLRSEK